MERCTDSYELLALNVSETTTDEEIERLAKRRQTRRKRRSRTPIEKQSIPSSSTNKNVSVPKFCWYILCLFFIGNILWISGLTWAATQLRTDVQALRNVTESVSAGSNVIPDSIQRCHSLTRQLEKNQTKMTNQLQRVAQKLANFSSMIIGIQTNLTKVERKLDELPSPQMGPEDMFERIGVAIAAFKAELMDMQTKASNIVNEQSEIKKMVDNLTGNVSSFNDDLKDLKKHSSGVLSSDQSSKDDLVNVINGEMEPKIQLVNSSIRSEVKWLSDDLQKAQKTISNLTDESEYLKSLINTTLHDLKLQGRDINILQNDITTYSKEWEKLSLVTKVLVTNVTKLVTSCSNCKYAHNEDSVDSTPIPSASEMSKSSTNEMADIPV
ncbi:unnamed protein product [Nezara viridula]|uniref:Uncharacterized protein n=1 Tax=Nezara viridula TaxID=85310 RepID=A0A9P0H369_NEZVI|nr:unnamed protein product [Nezara viridula]